jgi:hypothetical protein
MPGYPSNWYKYNTYPTEQKSQADYSPKNVAWFIERLASCLGVNHNQVILKYNDGTVQHPDDKLYYNDKVPSEPSPEWLHYIQKAKKSQRLKLFEQFAPGGAVYFQDSTVIVQAQSLVEVISLSPKITEIKQSVYAYQPELHLETPFLITFDQLPVDSPDVYKNITLKWVDKKPNGGTGKIVIDANGEAREHHYRLTNGYTYHQWIWEGKVVRRDDVNLVTVAYEGGLLTAMELEVSAFSQA